MKIMPPEPLRRCLPFLFVIVFFSASYSQQTVYTPLYTSGNFVKTIDVSKPVGAISGNASVSPTGGAIYSVPLYTPPGTNGMQPAISLSYSSQAGNGLAGLGWNISGLSVISRSGKNMYHNGIVNAVTYTTEDAFFLDGIRLNAISGSNGANNTIYATEAESFSQIISYTSGSANNPDWFKIISKDGSIMEFGHSIDSRFETETGGNVMLWRLNKLIDVNGNYIEFKYAIADTERDPRITQILYTGNTNTGLIPYNQVNFSYTIRTDQNVSYEAGGSIQTKYLLDKITVLHQNDLGGTETVKTYKLNYGTDNVHSMLKELIEYGGSESDPSLNSTIFLYGDQASSISSNQTVGLTGPYSYFSGDFNADGKTDLLAAQSYFDANVNSRLHTDYSLISDVNSSGYTLLYNYQLNQNMASEVVGDKKLFNFLNGDYNGDGRDDILLANSYSEEIIRITGSCSDGISYRRRLENIVINYTKGHNGQTGYTDYLPQTFPYPSHLLGNFQYISKNNHFFVPGDFDGNGNQDFILIVGRKRQDGTCFPGIPSFTFDYKAFLTSPSSNEINEEILNFGFGSNPIPDFYAGTVANADFINTVDFDGDGKMEILVVKDQQAYVLSINRVSATTGYSFAASVLYLTGEIAKDNKVFSGDYNGDKKTDLLVRNNNGTWKVLYSTGKAFVAQAFTFSQSVVFNGVEGDDLIEIGDFDGDGKSDILHGFRFGSNQSKISIYYSKGFSFFHEQVTYNNLLAPAINGSSEGIVVGDFNGDGKSDLLNRICVSCTSDFISFKPNGKELFLKKITNGHNATIAFEYKPLTDKSSYPYFYTRTVSPDNPANGNPYNYVELPLNTVSSISLPNGIGGWNTTEFKYEDAVVHRAAKGFLGFRKITASNTTTGMTSITENNINTEFGTSYIVKQQTKLTSTNELLSEQFFTNTFTNLSTGFSDKRYYHKIDKVLSVDHLNGKASEAVNIYDSYGNITSRTDKVGALSGTTVNPIETTTTTTSYSAHNTPVPAKPDNITVVKQRAGQIAKSETTSYTYTGNGLPDSKINFTGLPKAVTSTYTYNNFGNLVTMVMSASGVSNRNFSATFDVRGRYPISKQQTGGSIIQTKTFTMNGKWGLPQSSTTIDCQITNYTYDAFGRPATINLPTGASATIELGWAISGNDVYFRSVSGYPRYSKSWFDVIDREVHTETAGIGHSLTERVNQYDSRGNVSQHIPDHYLTDIVSATNYTYDNYNRLITSTSNLNTVQLTYSPLGNGNMQVVSSDLSGQNKTRITDATGTPISVIDNGGQLDYTYDSWSNQTQVAHGGTILLSSSYDDYGRQTSLQDNNTGTINYTYDAFGQLTQQVDSKGNTYFLVYDNLGRLATRTGGEGITTYTYDDNNVAGCGGNALLQVSAPNGTIRQYEYDAYRRPIYERLIIDGTTYTKQFAYDSYNRITSTTYPSGEVIERSFHISAGILARIYQTIPPRGREDIFVAQAMNGYGQYTEYKLNNQYIFHEVYAYGIPSRFYVDKTDKFGNTQTSFDFRFNFNNVTGNLQSRRDELRNISETFSFDNLNRLTGNVTNNGPGYAQVAVNYDNSSGVSRGNISNKTDAGYYVYRGDKINAVAYTRDQPQTGQPFVFPNPIPVTSQNEQNITYTPFLKAESISEGAYQLNFTYGPEQERVKTVLQTNGTVTETRYFFDDYEKQIKNGVTREIHYISGGNGLVAILVKEGTVKTIYTVYTDYLGNILKITDKDGNTVTEQSFDAWGRNRDPNNWNILLGPNTAPSVPDWLYRGYTGHEHLPQFALINMNGRIYDPVLGRMLSPDNYVPMPYSTQGYNRYGYANNNPLTYVDPDGQFLHIIVGALIGGTVNLVVKAVQGKVGSLGDGLKAFGVGAVAGGVGAATGGASLAATGLSGASVAGGALAGFTGSVVSSPILGFGNAMAFGDPYSMGDFGRDVLVGTAGGAFVGGTIAAFKGNNIWSGNPVASGRTIWSFNNSPLKGSGFSVGNSMNGGVFIDDPKQVISEFAGKSAEFTPNTGASVIDDAAANTKLPTQIHHFATNKHSFYTKQMENIAKQFRLDLDGEWNKAAMPHLGRHPNAYHEFVLKGMKDAAAEAGGSQARFLQLFDQYVKQPVLQNPSLLRKSGW